MEGTTRTELFSAKRSEAHRRRDWRDCAGFGLALIILPGPAIVVILVGLAILASKILPGRVGSLGAAARSSGKSGATFQESRAVSADDQTR